MEEAEDGPSFIEFESHADAVVALGEIGFVGADTAPTFDAEELIVEVGKLVSGIQFMDMSSTLPTTPSAAYKSLTIAAFTAAASSRKDDKAAFVIVRSELNTPSFLFGLHWNISQASIGEPMAAKRAPAAFVLFQEKHIEVPFEAGASVALAARIVAYELTGNKEHFCCALCGRVLKNDDGTFEPVGLHSDGRLFRRGCVEAALAEAREAALLSETVEKLSI